MKSDEVNGMGVRGFSTKRIRVGAQPMFLSALVLSLFASLMALSPTQASAEASTGQPAAAEDLIFYDDEIGRGVTRQVANNGALGGAWMDQPGWRDSWDVVLPVDVDGDGNDELFFYSADNRTAKIHNVSNSGGLSSKLWEATNWRRTWHTIVAVDVDGDDTDELFLYDRQNTAAKIIDLNANGSLGRTTWNFDNLAVWDIIEPIDANGNGDDELFFYNATRNRLSLWSLHASGQGLGANLMEWTNPDEDSLSFDIIEAVERSANNDKQDLYFYDAETGTHEVWDVNDKGNITSSSPLSRDVGRIGWDSVTPIDTDGDNQDELFFYDAEANWGKTHNLQWNGVIGAFLSQTGQLSSDYHTIASIRLSDRVGSPDPYHHEIFGEDPPANFVVNVAHTGERGIQLQVEYHTNVAPDDQEDDPTDNDPGGPVDRYQVWVDGVLNGDYPGSRYLKWVGNEQRRPQEGRFTLINASGLEPGTRYEIDVVAVDGDGNRRKVSRALATTGGHQPPPVDPTDAPTGSDTTPPTWNSQRVVTIGTSTGGQSKLYFKWEAASDYDDANSFRSVQSYLVVVDGLYQRTITASELAQTEAELDRPDRIDLANIPTYIDVPGNGVYRVGLIAVDAAGNRSRTLEVDLTFDVGGSTPAPAAPIEGEITGEPEVLPEGTTFPVFTGAGGGLVCHDDTLLTPIRRDWNAIEFSFPRDGGSNIDPDEGTGINFAWALEYRQLGDDAWRLGGGYVGTQTDGEIYNPPVDSVATILIKDILPWVVYEYRLSMVNAGEGLQTICERTPIFKKLPQTAPPRSGEPVCAFVEVARLVDPPNEVCATYWNSSDSVRLAWHEDHAEFVENIGPLLVDGEILTEAICTGLGVIPKAGPGISFWCLGQSVQASFEEQRREGVLGNIRRDDNNSFCLANTFTVAFRDSIFSTTEPEFEATQNLPRDNFDEHMLLHNPICEGGLHPVVGWSTWFDDVFCADQTREYELYNNRGDLVRSCPA